MPYTLNLSWDVRQLYHNKTGGKKFKNFPVQMKTFIELVCSEDPGVLYAEWNLVVNKSKYWIKVWLISNI